MNTFQSCRNISDAVQLYLPQNLYLKPIARILISIQLPHQIESGKLISNWEIMEKLRALIKPEEFCILKVTKNSLEFILFEAEIEDKSKLFEAIALLDAQTIKLNSLSQNVKIRATEAKINFPSRHTWDSYFRDSKNMDEMKPGERPDTLHITNLPIKWFAPSQHTNKDGLKPSLKIFQRVFEKFGHIRYVDIPICDPYRSKMKEHINGMKTFTFDQETLFEGYVQFKDYIGFARAMDAFRGMKLLHKEGNDNAQTMNIKVDFDKTKHLSDASIRRRQIVRERLVAKDRDKEEKEKQELVKISREEQEKRRRELEQTEEKERRRREREERRKAKHFAQLKLKETEELKKKIAKEERKLLKAQRKLEAIRLLEELFNRIKLKRQKDEEAVQSNIDNHSSQDELTKFKIAKEQKVKEQREKLHKALEGHVVLNSILGDDKRKNTSSESSSDSESGSDRKHKKKKKSKKHKKKSKSHKEKHEKTDSNQAGPSTSSYPPNQEAPIMPMTDPTWFMPPSGMYPFPPMYRPPMPGYFSPRGRGNINHNNGASSSSRGHYPRRRGAFNPYWGRGWRGRRGASLPHYTPELEQEYYKYFRKFLNEDSTDDRDKQSYSRSRSRSSSYDRHRSRRRSHSRRRSRSSSRSRSRSSRSRSRSKSRRRSRKSRSRSRSKSRGRAKGSRSPSYQSIDSSKFISPSRLRSKRSRSKSWSLPRNNSKKRSSWSKTPSPVKK